MFTGARKSLKPPSKHSSRKTTSPASKIIEARSTPPNEITQAPKPAPRKMLPIKFSITHWKLLEKRLQKEIIPQPAYTSS